MLESRVARLEDDMRDMKTSLRAIELAVADIRHLPKAADYAGLRAEIAEMRGRMSQMPTFLQLVGIVLTTWSAGAAIVFTLVRFAKP